MDSSVTDDLIFQMDLSDDEDVKPIKKQTGFLKKGKLDKDLKRAADVKKYGRLVDDVGGDIQRALLKRKESDEVSRLIKSIKKHNDDLEDLF